GWLMVMSKNKIPAALRVVVCGPAHPDAGVMQVKFWGTSRAIGRQLKMLSHFHLRVASPRLSVGPAQQLRYGLLLDKHRIDLGLCRRWLDHCTASHRGTCQAPRWAATLEKLSCGTGFYLIDVVNNTLVHKSAAADECAYAALSYVWGPPERFSSLLYLTSANAGSLLARRNSITPRVGQTIWDAMAVARALGLRYLWADRLCIVQDSAADKAAQVRQMDRVYGGAAITIVAATGAHLDAGLAGVGAPRAVAQLARQVTRRPPVNVLLPVATNRNRDGDGTTSPWATRAWTLQEKLLSRRLLVFRDGAVDFCCARGTLHEDMSAADAHSDPP
ncbi:heterokaryon incompatibility protein-domain-containing protein, partial [Lasiosphaeria miniovina]